MDSIKTGSRPEQSDAKDKTRARKLSFFKVAVLLAALAAATGLLRLGFIRFMKAAYPLEYSDLVNKYSEQYGFEPSLIFALIHTESGFDHQAVSHKKAIGLMQITEDTFEWAQFRFSEKEALPVEMLYDPETNIHYGIRILSLLKEEFEDTKTMLAAYNAGVGNVRRWLKTPEYSDDGASLKSIPYEETSNYVSKIPKTKSIYRKLYDIE
ncbi:MAG: lytic transglycosylase domain-containing protein [Clostridiales bacterium]|jgi:soluble lytic murein transglycosylase|nr:lytic transglycosylase domain-containing protein [Clostridiales bacterium]